MKTRLLKRIRRQYSIVYYPNGFKWDNMICHKGEYVLHKRWRGFLNTSGYGSKQSALDAMLQEIRREYRKKDKGDFYRGVKVWWND